MRTSFMNKNNGQLTQLFFVLYLAILISGCSLGGKPAYLIKQYIFEYPPPVVEGVVQTNELIKVERFSTAQDFNTLSMV